VDAGTSPITKPTAAGTAYSWHKTLLLMVTGHGGATSLSDRKIRFDTAAQTGLYGFFKDGADTYTQATSGNKPADDVTTDGAVPSTWTAISTTFQTWDAASEAAVNSTRNGNFVQVLVGVGSNYAAGAGASIALPDLQLQYLES
jgi:hypothetical protein